MSTNYSQKTKSLVEVGLSSRTLEASRPPVDALTYEPYFGLDEKPFSLNADHCFVYRSPSYGATRDGLLAGIRRREGLHVLTGEIGTGKTTLCQDVIRELGRKTYSSMVPDPFASREDLLKMLLIDFGVLSIQELTSGRLQQASRTELGYLLAAFLESLTPDDFVVAIIDEAQNLTLPLIEETRILADTFGASGRLQMVFVGQPELHTKLKLPEMRQVDQRVCGYHRLSPMDREAVAGYIEHRLHVAGVHRERVLFSAEIVNRLHLRTGGVPRLINRVCDRALQLAYERKAERVDRVTLEAALTEIGSATLSPTWDAIMADAPVPPPGGATASPPPAAPARNLETPPTVDDAADFQRDIDQWVSKDLMPAARARSVSFSEPTPEQLRAWRRSPRTPFRRAEPVVSHPPVEWPAEPAQTVMQRVWHVWTKRLALAIAFALAVMLGTIMLSQEPVEPPAHAPVESAPTADTAPVETPDVQTPATESTPAPPAAAAPIAAAGEEYLVSVGLFSARDRADQLLDTLTRAGLPALQRPFRLGNRDVQQIVLGPFFSRADAVAELRRLQALGGHDDARVIDNQ